MQVCIVFRFELEVATKSHTRGCLQVGGDKRRACRTSFQIEVASPLTGVTSIVAGTWPALG